MYSGAFRRFFAYLIDCAVMIGSYMLIAFVMGMAAVFNPLLALPMFGIWYFFGLFCYAWLYNALFECSKWQGTVGKRVLGLRVVDLSGNRISFLRASGRHFSKMVSRFTLMIGYLMIFWTKRKQALHDKMAKTLVVHDCVEFVPSAVSE